MTIGRGTLPIILPDDRLPPSIMTCFTPDNGPEFVSKVICRWLKQADVKTLFIAKGSPWENGYVESFNGTLRDELLNREILSCEEAMLGD